MRSIVIAAATTLMFSATAFAGDADTDHYEGSGCAKQNHTASVVIPTKRPAGQEKAVA